MWTAHLKRAGELALTVAVSTVLTQNSLSAANFEGGGAFAPPKKQKKIKSGTVNQPKSGGTSAKRSARGTVSGRWRLVTNCNTGKFVILLNLTQTSPTSFNGSTHTISGSTKGTRTRLYGGKISGNKVSYTRGTSWKTYARGTISANRRRMSGSEKGAMWTCTFVATKR